MGRHFYFFIDALLKDPNVSVEVWTINRNFLSIKKLFLHHLKNYPKQFSIHTENSSTSGAFSTSVTRLKSILYLQLIRLLPKKRKSRLIREHTEKAMSSIINKVNNASKPDLYVCSPIHIIHSYLKINHDRKAFIFHDLFTIEFADLFGPSILNINDDFLENLNLLQQQGAFFICSSDHIRMNHCLKYIHNLKERNTTTVRLPVNVPSINLASLPSKNTILPKFKIPESFIFYPSHLRPYKNVITLIKALHILWNKGSNIKLVLTGRLKSNPEVLDYIKQNQLLKNIIPIGSVSEKALYALYKYATLSVVPTLGEGSFPWQTMEAILMDCPVITSNIPVVREWMTANNFNDIENYLVTFDPHNETELAQKIEFVLANRELIIQKQKKIQSSFNEYTWNDAAKAYLDVFQKIINQA